MQITKIGRNWWTQSDRPSLLSAQEKLFRALIPHRKATPVQAAGMNAVAFRAEENQQEGGDDKRPTCVVAHGFGSGLGFFYANVDRILGSGKFKELVLIDWLGMGGSERPACWNRPYRSLFRGCSSWCDSYFTTEQSVDFFIDPLEAFLEETTTGTRKNNTYLVGHSLGGYLAARYALKYPARLSKLVLASPVGFPRKPSNVLPSTEMPTSLRLIDALWSSNVTPQTLVRIQGATRGRRNVQRILQGRIPALAPEQTVVLAEYLYHITVAASSGEFAMNSLLEPAVSPDVMGVFAREPLEDRLLDLHPNIDLRVNFGDSDWMRNPPNEPSARRVIDSLGRERARLDIVENAGHHLYLENDQSFTRSVLT